MIEQAVGAAPRVQEAPASRLRRLARPAFALSRAFWRVPLQVKLAAPLLLTLAASASALGYFDVRSTQQRIEATAEVAAQEQAAAAAALYASSPGRLNQDLAQYLAASPSTVAIAVYAPGAGGLHQVGSAGAALPDTLAAAPARSSWSAVGPGAAPLRLVYPAQSGVVVVVDSSANLERQVSNDLLLNLLLAGLVDLLVLLTLVRLWVRFLVHRRLRRLGAAAAGVADGALSVSLKEGLEQRQGDEITELAVQLNRMIGAARVRSTRQGALDSLTEQALQGLGLGQLMTRAAQLLQSGFSVPVAAVYETFAPSGMLLLRASAGPVETKRQLALMGRRQFHARVLDADDPIAADHAAAAQLGLPRQFHRVLATRIPGRFAAFGMLVVASDGPGEFSTDQAEFLQAVAHTIATAVNALHDPLTGLPNRVLFEDRLTQALDEGRRTGDSVCLHYIDLDNFKEVNDTLGHHAGDQLLRHVADRLRKVLRTSDVLARLGGDEFALVQTMAGSRHSAAAGQPEPDVEAIASRTAERLLETLAPPFAIESSQLYVGASIGIAVYPEHGNSATVLKRNADRAMYEGKLAQKGGYHVFAPAMHSAAMRRLTIESGLRAALQRDELALHFQPQVDVSMPGTIVGFEALLRWRGSDGRPIAPSTFIPIAEQTGLIVPLGLWALRQACIQAVEWQRLGYPPVRMAVNVAPAQFARPEFVETVRRVLAETGLDPSLLELEVTEGSVMRDLDNVTARLNELRELGVTIAVDDFGTGYSSLAYLNRLPFDSLKVDRSFVSNIPNRGKNPDGILVGAIVQLGRNLKKIVVAEGIETLEQLQHLQDIGCDVGQGFYFARAVEAEQAGRLLQGRSAGAADGHLVGGTGELGPAEQKALAQLDPKAAHLAKLGGGLDAFSQHVRAQRLGERHHRSRQRLAQDVVVNPAHE